MRNKNEIQQLIQELEMIMDVITESGNEQEFELRKYGCDVLDTLDWVLEEITTEQFKSSDFIDLAKLHATIKEIEQRTKKKKNGNLS